MTDKNSFRSQNLETRMGGVENSLTRKPYALTPHTDVEILQTNSYRYGELRVLRAQIHTQKAIPINEHILTLPSELQTFSGFGSAYLFDSNSGLSYLCLITGNLVVNKTSIPNNCYLILSATYI